eukprot:10938407-Lingulodinium_polyedra.AAC.1
MRTPTTGARMVCVTRAVCEPPRRQMIDSAASLRTVLKTVHHDAVESIICCRNGSKTARIAHTMRTTFA